MLLQYTIELKKKDEHYAQKHCGSYYSSDTASANHTCAQRQGTLCMKDQTLRMWQRAFNMIDKQCIKHIIPKETNSNSKQTKLLCPLAAQPTLHHWSAQFSHRSLHHMNTDCLWYRCKAVNTIIEMSSFFVSKRKCCKDFSANTAQEVLFSCRLPLEQCLQRSLYNYIQRHSPAGTAVC